MNKKEYKELLSKKYEAYVQVVSEQIEHLPERNFVEKIFIKESHCEKPRLLLKQLKKQYPFLKFKIDENMFGEITVKWRVK